MLQIPQKSGLRRFEFQGFSVQDSGRKACIHAGCRRFAGPTTEELEPKHQPIGKWKGLAGAVLACLSTSLAMRAIIFTPPPSADGIKARAEAERHMHAAAQCEGELRQIDDEYIVDSLLLDTNFSEINTIERLLGDSGIRFVELKANRFKLPYDEAERWGVWLLPGNGGKTYDVNPDTKYVRFELSKAGDPHCDASSHNRLDIKLQAPFAPDACIRVTTDQKSLASHAIKALPATDGTDFIRWTLLEQSSGNALVALTSSDRPDRPEGSSGGGKSRSVKYGKISCFGPYFTLPQALGGIPGHATPSLSLVRRRIEPRLVDLNSDSVIWSEINVDAAEAPKAEAQSIKDTALFGEGWRTAYAKAQSSGYASVDRELIDYKAGELLSLGTLKFEKELSYPHTTASKHGFAILFNPGSGMHLARFALNGELEWQGIIRIKGDPDPTSRPPSIESIRWDEEEIKIYLVKFKENVATYRLLTIQNSLVGIKRGRAISSLK
jgi:hypothetical protein